MSSHREAPEISKDPVADSTDLYAFVSPDAPSTVTLIANYVPLQGPAGGPNFYEFGDDVLYEINIDNDNDGEVDITFQFQFTTEITVGGTFLYNVGPIGSLTDGNWNRRQFYSVTRIDWDRPSRHRRRRGHHHAQAGRDAARRRISRARRATSARARLRTTTRSPAPAVQTLPDGTKVFAGQRAEGFYVDLGSIFDLGALRPIQSAAPDPDPGQRGRGERDKDLNVHSIALQIPTTLLTSDGNAPTDPKQPFSVIGVWTTASRQRVRFNHHWHDRANNPANVGPWTQVSRLGNPLFNEVLVPMERKDDWNQDPPHQGQRVRRRRAAPRAREAVAGALPGCVPEPRRARRVGQAACRPGRDPAHRHPARCRQPELPELHRHDAGRPVAVEHGDPAVGRRRTTSAWSAATSRASPTGGALADDVVNIELKAIAGATYPLDRPDVHTRRRGRIVPVDQGIDQREGTNYLSAFPYLGTPHSGYEMPAA